MWDIGVIARVVQNLKLPNGNVKVMVEGVERARLTERLEEVDGAALAIVETFDAEYELDEADQVLHEQGARALRAVRQDVPPLWRSRA